MKKLQALVDHLTAAMVAKPEQITGVMESGEPLVSFEESGPDLLIFHHRYTARVVLEDLPRDLTHVLAATCAWLEEFGDARADELLGWIGEPSDDKLGDVDIRVQLDEEARYVPKPQGYTGRDVVTWRGVDYVPGEQVADKATEVELEGATE